MTNIQNNFVSGKALKLATALYMVTDIMSEKEPLKWSLRERAVSLIEATDKNIMSVINETLAILTIARITRAVSQMNAEVLESEFHALGETLKNSVHGTVEAMLTTDFFVVEENPTLPAPLTTSKVSVLASVTQAPVIATAVKPTTLASTRIEKAVTEKDIKDTATSAIRSTYMEEPKKTDTPAVGGVVEVSEMRTARDVKVAVERNKRRDAIVRLMYEKGECNVKDIAYILKDVSEKTIQRELIAMMEEGVIAREGDRRWAVYHLA